MKILIILLLPVTLWGNTEFKTQMDELLHLNAENFSNKIEGYRKNFDGLFAKKKAICTGKFSSNILEEGEASIKKKLTKDEKKLCMDNMKKMQREYINGKFLARKRYLEYLHKIRVQNLTEAKQLELKNLNAF